MSEFHNLGCTAFVFDRRFIKKTILTDTTDDEPNFQIFFGS
jgi:hypothetical protein